MRKHIQKSRIILVTILLGFPLLGYLILLPNKPKTLNSAGINATISFQGKVVNTNGTNVPNGTYNMEFKIYQDGDGAAGGAAETLKWTESRLRDNSQGVTVTDGIFQVNLGSVNAFGSSIDWNQDTLWLSVNLGDTVANCTPFSSCNPDGEMDPYMRFTATPYALNSNMLGGLTSSGYIQIANGAQTDSSNSDSSIFINKTGSAALITLQNGGVDIFGVDNDGDLSFGSNADHVISVNYNLSGAGKSLTLLAGDAASADDIGGNLIMQAGNGTGTQSGGGVNISGGVGGATDGDGGLVFIYGGLASGAGTGGNVALSGGFAANAGSNGGGVSLQGANGSSTGTGGSAGSVSIIGGNAGGSGANDGGSVSIQSGTKTGAGNNGSINIGTANVANTIQIGNTANNVTQTINIGNLNTTGTTNLTIGTGTSATGGSTSIQAKGAVNIQGGSNTGTVAIGNSSAGAITVQSASTVGITGTTTITGLSSGVALTVNNSTSSGNVASLQDNGTNVFVVADGGNVGIKTGATAPTYDLSFGSGADRTIRVETQASSNTAGNALTIQSGTGNGAFDGGALTIQAGTSGSGGNGGVLNLLGGARTSGATSGGAVNVTGGTGNGLAAGGTVTITGGPAGNFGGAVVTANGGSVAGAGDLSLIAGSATSGVVNGGNVSLQSGSSAGGTNGNISIGTSNIANTITIGNTSNALAQTINLGSNSTAGSTTAVNIGGSETGSTTIISGGANAFGLVLSAAGAGQATLQAGASGNVNIQVGSSGSIALGTSNANSTTIGNSNASTTVAIQAGGGINIGTANAANTIQIGNVANAIAQTIAIGNNATGSSTTNVTIGNLLSTSATTLQGGTGASAVSIKAGSAGTISIGNSGVANTIQIGTTTGAVAQTINIGNNATGSSTGNITMGNLLSTSATLIQGGTGASAIALQAGTSGTISVGTSNANTVTIGGTNASTSVALQGGGGINIGTGNVGNTIQIGNTANNVTQTINIGNLNTTGTTNVTIGTGASATGGTTTINSKGLTTIAGGGLTITPTGTSDVIINQAAGVNTQITASAAPTVDMLAISNASQGNVTAGVSGLQINYEGGAAAVEASGARIDITGGTTAGGGAIWNGLRLVQGTITAGTTVQDIKLETAALTSTSANTSINGLNLSSAGAISNTTAGSITWQGISITNPNVTQGSGGTATATAFDINLGTLTTNGRQTGLQLDNITAPTAGQTRGLSFGTGWNDTHSSTAATNNLANIMITGTTAANAAQTFTIKSTNNISGGTTATPLLEIRDLSNANNTRFAGLTLSDAFISRQTYWGEEFNNFRANSTVTMATTASGTAGVRGDTTALSINGVAGVSATGSTGTYSANAANGYEEITCVSANAARSSNCLLTNNNGTAGQQWAMFNTGNMPQIAMKFRAGNGVAPSSSNFYYAGISNQAVAVSTGPTNSYAVTTKGAYFTNCSSPNATVSGCGNTWFGVVADGATTPAAPSTNEVACPATDQQGSGPQNANFMYGRIEFRRDTSGTTVEIQYFIDYDVTNGITETSCGTVATTGATMGNTAMGIFLDAFSAGNATAKLDIDYVRVYQDDSIPTTPPTSQTNLPESSSTPPLTFDTTNNTPSSDFFNFMGATSEDAVIAKDLYVHGTLFVDKIKANKIEGLEISTGKINSLATAKSINNSTTENSEASDDLSVEGKLIVNGGLTINSTATFASTAEFQKLVSFLDNVTFNSDVSFLGRPTFNNDTGGFAVIPAGQQSVEIKFTKAYDDQPVIGLAINNGQFAMYSYTYIKDDLGKYTGFKINVSQAYEAELQFSWTALNIKDAKTAAPPPVQ